MTKHVLCFEGGLGRHFINLVPDDRVPGQGRYRNDQAPEGRRQGRTDAASQHDRISIASTDDDGLEGHDHAVDRSEEADHRAHLPKYVEKLDATKPDRGLLVGGLLQSPDHGPVAVGRFLHARMHDATEEA